MRGHDLKSLSPFGRSLALCLAALASASGEGASESYLLRNAWLDGTRMASGPAPIGMGPFPLYHLKSVYLGSPIQGAAMNGSHSLHVLAGTWTWQPGDPPPTNDCMFTPNFCSGPGVWNHPSPRPLPGGSPPAPVTSVRSLTRQLRLSGRLYGPGGNLPVGAEEPVQADVQVGLYRTAVGDTAVYEEAHTAQAGNSVLVDGGRFTLYLGSAPGSGDLEQALAGNDNLFAQFHVDGQILQPRLPITGGLFSGTPTVLEGAADPTAEEPRGAYYRNTAAGSTWIRMTSSWVRIAP